MQAILSRSPLTAREYYLGVTYGTRTHDHTVKSQALYHYEMWANVTMLPHIGTYYNLYYINIKFFLKDHRIISLTKENYKETQ